MSTIGQIKKKTQNRVIALFLNELGYHTLGHWTDHEGFDGNGNSNIWANW